ncbi:hypothetical protein Q1695_013289 [Nippostrongylus brasiliensis]|nr:hypothetical protein Q1695_013289 [Nippostrongylus brasiliensis]
MIDSTVASSRSAVMVIPPWEQKMDSHEQLRELQRELRQLKQAIPPLPEPQQLYDRIVQQCHDNHEYTETTTQLEQRLRHL